MRRSDDALGGRGRRIEIVELPGVEGEEIELSSHGDERTLVVDGEREFGSIPALERPDHVVRARRIVGDAWEVETARSERSRAQVCGRAEPIPCDRCAGTTDSRSSCASARAGA